MKRHRMRAQALLAGLGLAVVALAAPNGAANALQSSPKAEMSSVVSLQGAWTTRVLRDENGRVQYCQAEAPFESDRSLILALAPGNGVNIGIGFLSGRLPAGGQWPVTVAIDSLPPVAKVAVAVAADVLVIPYPDGSATLAAVAEGRNLTIRSEADVVTFRLEGTKRAAADLAACITRRGEGFAEGRSSGSDALPVMLAQLLAAAGLAEATPVDLSAMAEASRPADYVWRIGSVIGGVRERPVSPADDLIELAKAHLNGLSARCGSNGGVSLGKIEAAGPVELLSASFTCSNRERSVHAAVLYRRVAGSRLTTIVHEAPAAVARAADAARDALAAVLRDPAQPAFHATFSRTHSTRERPTETRAP